MRIWGLTRSRQRRYVNTVEKDSSTRAIDTALPTMWRRSSASEPGRAETTLNQEPGNPQSLENQVRHSCEHCGDNEQASAGPEDSPQPTAGQVKEPRNSSSTWLNASGCSIGG